MILPAAKFLFLGLNDWLTFFNTNFHRKTNIIKIRLLIRKLSIQKNYHYKNYILPKQPTDFTFTEIVELLKDIFGKNSKIVRFVGFVNRQCKVLTKFQIHRNSLNVWFSSQNWSLPYILIFAPILNRTKTSQLELGP